MNRVGNSVLQRIGRNSDRFILRSKYFWGLSTDRHLRVVAPELFIHPDFLSLNLHD
nr:hypothetical protein [Leptospira interrogans]